MNCPHCGHSLGENIQVAIPAPAGAGVPATHLYRFEPTAAGNYPSTPIMAHGMAAGCVAAAPMNTYRVFTT